MWEGGNDDKRIEETKVASVIMFLSLKEMSNSMVGLCIHTLLHSLLQIKPDWVSNNEILKHVFPALF